MKGNANQELALIRKALAVKPKLEVVKGSIEKIEDRTPPRSWPRPAPAHKDTREYIVLRYRSLRKGTLFLPIEKTGKSFYFRDSKGKLLKDRRYEIGNELYYKDEPYRASRARDGKDGVFSANDWCIVPKD